MLLTRLFKYVMGESLELFNESYVLDDRVMYPLTAQQERKTRKDYGTKRGRHSTSSSSAFGQPSSSNLNDDDDDDDGNVKGPRMQALLPLFVFDEDATTTPYPIRTSSPPSLPNAPSKTPSTKDISSTFGTTSSSSTSKPQSSPPTSNDPPSPQPSNHFF
ncbi:hypothetical protein Tco_0585423 [Tanacetum coccineum]